MVIYINLSFHISVLGCNEFKASIVRLLELGTIFLWYCDQHAGCGSLGLASLADFGSALNVNVGNTFVFTEDREV